MNGDTVFYATLLIAAGIGFYMERAIKRMERIEDKMRDRVSEMNAAIDAFNEEYYGEAE